jgi:hypothetical protein
MPPSILFPTFAKLEQNPIVAIGHSMGGLVIKKVRLSLIHNGCKKDGSYINNLRRHTCWLDRIRTVKKLLIDFIRWSFLRRLIEVLISQRL